MTNAATYVYEKLEDYVKIYPQGQDTLTENHLCSLWMDDKTIVLVGNNSEKTAKDRPDFSKSVVYFDGGDKEFKKYEDRFEPVLEVIKKGNTIKVVGEKKELPLFVQREYGDAKENEGHVKGYILYDDSRPRINFIMKPVTSENS